MPFGKCPKCGAIYHLSVGNVDAWYRDYWPELKIGDVVPDLCFRCWQIAGEPESFRTDEESDDSESRSQ